MHTFFFFFNNFIYLFLFGAVLDLQCHLGFSLVVESGGHSLVVVRRLTVVAAVVVDHGL